MAMRQLSGLVRLTCVRNRTHIGAHQRAAFHSCHVKNSGSTTLMEQQLLASCGFGQQKYIKPGILQPFHYEGQPIKGRQGKGNILTSNPQSICQTITRDHREDYVVDLGLDCVGEASEQLLHSICVVCVCVCVCVSFVFLSFFSVFFLKKNLGSVFFK